MRGPTYFNSELLHGGMQGMGADMYGSPNPGYSPHRPPVHSQAMLIPGHPHHHMMMAAHSGHMGHMGVPSAAQSPPLHGSMDGGMAHIQDIHAG